jgi:hypothetical protein
MPRAPRAGRFAIPPSAHLHRPPPGTLPRPGSITPDPDKSHPDLKGFVGGFMQGTMISAAFMALPEGSRVAFVDHVAGLLGGYVDDGGMALPLENHFLTARR